MKQRELNSNTIHITKSKMNDRKNFYIFQKSYYGKRFIEEMAINLMKSVTLCNK